MSIVVNCPKCQAKLRGPDELAGRMVRCKSCQEKFRVPGGDPAGSVSDTQQLSVVGSSMAIPAVPAKAAILPAPLPPAGTPTNPLPLDDLHLEELPKPAIPLPSTGTLDPSDLLEEPKPAADPFSFEEPLPEAVKKKKRKADYEDDDDEDDRPRKKKRTAEAEDEDERPTKRGYQKRAGTPWGIIIGVGVALLAIGSGVTVLLLTGGDGKKQEEAKTKVEPLPVAPVVEPKSKTGKAKGKESETKPPDESQPKGPDTPKTPPKKKEPPKKGPPQPPAMKLPDPPTGALTLIGKAKWQVSLDFPVEKVREVRVAGPSLVVAFNSQPGFQGAGAKDTVRQYSLETGVKGRQFEFDSTGLPGPRAFAAGANGLVAVEAGGPGKVTVYDFDTNSALLEKQDVFADAGVRVGPIAALALGADRKLFVVDQAGTVDVWDLTVRQRTVTGTPAKRAGAGKPAAKAAAAGGGVVVALDGKVWTVNAAGAVGGTIPLPDSAAVPLAVGPGPVADRAVVAYQLPGGKHGVAALSLSDGTVAFHTSLPDGAAPPTEVSWPADTILAVSTGDAGFIVDTEARLVTGYVKAVSGKAAVYPTGAGFWWLMAGPAEVKGAFLHGAELPPDGYYQERLPDKARADRKPIFLVPRPDGLGR